MNTDMLNTFDVVLICSAFVVPITPVRAIPTGLNLGDFGTM